MAYSCKNKKKALSQEEKEKSTLRAEETPDVKPQMSEDQGQEERDQILRINKQIEESVVARIERTSCFGRCPIYVLSVYEDGRVFYQGKKFVEREGDYLSKIEQKKIDQIFQRAESIGFFKMKSVYDSEHVTDLPSTIISLRIDGELKTIINRYQGPEKLTEFGKYFDAQFEQLNWSEQDKE